LKEEDPLGDCLVSKGGKMEGCCGPKGEKNGVVRKDAEEKMN
jgi:hypothetical protein